jgi:hypothetical protein
MCIFICITLKTVCLQEPQEINVMIKKRSRWTTPYSVEDLYKNLLFSLFLDVWYFCIVLLSVNFYHHPYWHDTQQLLLCHLKENNKFLYKSSTEYGVVHLLLFFIITLKLQISMWSKIKQQVNNFTSCNVKEHLQFWLVSVEWYMRSCVL